jgi:hemolysin III
MTGDSPQSPPSAAPPKPPHVETPIEEALNSLTHGVGAVLSIAGLGILVTLASLHGGPRHVVTVSIYGCAMLLLYLASTCYHACRHPRARHWLRVADHIAIYCLIAGTYTPFLLVSVRGAWGWSLFGVLWGLTLVGAVLKLFFVHRFDLASTLIYLAMGWIGVIGARPLMHHLPHGALQFIVAGGLAYTVGVVFYLWENLPFNHAIWHLFVMAGSACHFFGILYYVVPP